MYKDAIYGKYFSENSVPLSELLSRRVFLAGFPEWAAA
jgi:hypothetical protein